MGPFPHAASGERIQVSECVNVHGIDAGSGNGLFPRLAFISPAAGTILGVWRPVREEVISIDFRYLHYQVTHRGSGRVKKVTKRVSVYWLANNFTALQFAHLMGGGQLTLEDSDQETKIVDLVAVFEATSSHLR